jgi:flagellar motility protein MotE (MotC chaperone)
MPRVLPLTIVVMAMLLGLKSVVLVRAAVPPPGSPIPPVMSAPAEAATPAPPAVVPLAAAAPAPPAPSGEPPVSNSERALLLDLRHRRAELDARQAALDARDAVLAATETRLATRVDELTALQARLEALEAARKQRDDANWTGLVKLYESMKPRDAATIFNDLDMPVLLQVVDRMKEQKAAPVLAAMQPERARQVTSQLAALRGRANAVPAATKPGG